MKNEQLIITFENPETHAIHKYTTAYTEDQAKHYLMKCLERYGRVCNARIVEGKKLTL